MLSLVLSYPEIKDWEAQRADQLLRAEALEQANKVLDTIRLTGLEPANLKDAASLSLLLLQYHNKNTSWHGLTQYLGEGKTTLAPGKPPF